VIIKVTVHDLMMRMWPNGAGAWHLRQNLWVRFLEICCQSSINELNVGGIGGFEFKMAFKL